MELIKEKYKMDIQAEMIPAWIIALSWLYTGFIWIKTKDEKIRMDSRIWGWTFIIIGSLYLFPYIPHESRSNTLTSLEFRLVFTRLLMLLLSMSQWLPLTISYLRRRN